MHAWRLVILFLVATACGETLAPANDPDGGTAADAGDAAPNEPREGRLSTIPCGTIECGERQACCLASTGATCSGIGTACPVDPDGGADAAPAPPPLNCTTYNNCNYDEDCCYEADAGSKCSSTCAAAKLCRLGRDGCGYNAECKAFAGSPDPSIGRCAYSGGTSSGGSQ